MRLRVAIYLLYFVFAMLLNSVGILIQRSMAAYGVNEVQASTLEGFKDLSIALVSFLVGSLLPKLGYKKGVMIGLLMVLVGCIIMYFGNAFWSVQILFACTGMAFAVIKVAVYALISEMSDSKTKLNSFLSSVESFFMIGIAAAYIIFPLFYSDTNPDGWLNIYLLLGTMILVSLLFISTIRFDEGKASQSLSEKVSFRDQFKLLKQPLVLVFALSAFLYVMTEQGIMSWLPTFNKEVLGISENLSVTVSVILALSIALGRALSSMIVKSVQWLYILLACLAASVIMIIFVLPMAQGLLVSDINTFRDIPLAGYIFPLIGLFLAPIYPLMNAAVLGATDDKLFSQMAGILTFFSALGGTLGSRIVGFLFQNKGGGDAFYFALIPLGILVFSLIYLSKLSKGVGKA